MYKKIYLEITNNCNLNCDFCIKNSRLNKFMSFDEFKLILNKINNHTKYLYFHILGEPLLHPNINEFIEFASKNYKINITTNGYLIDRIKNNKNIRQINISLHSYNEIGTCYALTDHIGILVDGTIIPCCLDSKGIIKLGNIFENTLDEIIKSSRYQNMLNGFKNNKKCEMLCRKCNYLENKTQN